MAKEKVQTERSKKVKTPAQLAKKVENERKAAERLAKMQEQQRMCKELRAKGYVGSDFQIMKQLEDQQKAAEEARVEAMFRLFKEKQVAYEKKYVEEAIDGPSGEVLKKWLRGPAKYSAVVKFFKSHNLPRVAEVKKEEQVELPKLNISIPAESLIPGTVETVESVAT